MAAALPAGPKGHPILGVLPEYKRDRLSFLLRCAHEYGDLVPMRFGPYRICLISDPVVIERVLVTDHRNFIKSRALRRTTPMFGNGLLTSEGDFWRRQRKLIQPAFHRERIAAYGQIMVDYTRQLMARWSDGLVCDIHAEMLKLTLQIAVKTLFGAEVEEAEQVGRALQIAQEDFVRWIHYIVMLPEWFPTPTTPRLAGAIRHLDAVVYKIIQDRRACGEDLGDLLSLLLRAQDEDDGSYMTDKQLRDEVLTLFLAGHDTTALALTWALYLLAQHPEVEAKLCAELDSALAGRPPTLEDRVRLKYTERVILEAMRLYPPAWTLGRTALADYPIGAVEVPAGTTLIMSQWVVHRDPRLFADPERFEPDRWANDFAKTLPRFAYFPFGGGPRICIGNTFAMMESVLLLATLAQRYQFCLVAGQRVVPQAAVTLRPAQGVRMKIFQK